MKRFKTLALILLLSLFCHTNETLVVEANNEKYDCTFIDTIDYEKINEIKEISVVIKLRDNEIDNNNGFSNAISVEERESLLQNHKNTNKEKKKKWNKHLDTELNLTNLGYVISDYSPFTFKTFSNYEEFQKDSKFIKKISKNKNIDTIYIEANYNGNKETLSTTNIDYSSSIIHLANAIEMIGASDPSFTGNGIKVGIIDEGYISNTTNFVGKTVVNLNNIYSGQSNHTTGVASIIGGIYGIAPDVELYFYNFDAGNNLKTAVESMIDENISLINISMYSDYHTGNYALYDGYSAYLDYISWYYGVCFVVAAGNEITSLNVVNPSLGFNVISVGSTDANKNISVFSSWRAPEADFINDPSVTTNSHYLKPTLVAPGENIVIPNVTLWNSNPINYGEDGTSFAAPMVTGIIALLMEEYPLLIGEPHLVASALISGCEKLPGQTETWDPQGGAGFINYKNTRKVLEQIRNYCTSSLSNENNNNDLLMRKWVYSSYEEIIRICLVNNFNSNVLSPSDNLYTIDNSPICIKIYKDSELIHTYYSTKNIYLIEFEHNDSIAANYQIDVLATNSKYSAYTEKLALTIHREHKTHSYFGSYEWLSTSKHLSYCECGESIISNHMVKANSSTCLLCGGIANSIIGGL